MSRILLGHLTSNGDCLYATAIARQIKQNFPGCHLTWAISSLCRNVLVNNPDVDEVWEVPMADWSAMRSAWTLFEREAHDLADAGRFDHVFLTQISPARFANYDGTVRPSIFRNFGSPLTVPIDVTINLKPEERAAVDAWFAGTPAADASQVVLFECSSKSGQSFVTLPVALALAEEITRARRRTAVIVSTHEPFESDNPRIVCGDTLSIRQVARLTDHVDLFVGCGSGLTVAATSEAAKPGLPNIQILRRETSVYASFRHDFTHFGKPTAHFMELTSEDPAHLAKALIGGFVRRFRVGEGEIRRPGAPGLRMVSANDPADPGRCGLLCRGDAIPTDYDGSLRLASGLASVWPLFCPSIHRG